MSEEYFNSIRDIMKKLYLRNKSSESLLQRQLNNSSDYWLGIVDSLTELAGAFTEEQADIIFEDIDNFRRN